MNRSSQLKSGPAFPMRRKGQEATESPILQQRRFKHAINPWGGIDSVCMQCGELIACLQDEWCLLSCEEHHICGLRQSARIKSNYR